MTELSADVRKLTEPWVIVLSPKEAGDWKAQDFPPLLDMLRELVAPSKNTRGGGGDVATRNVLDAKALDLLMHIEDVTLAWLAEWRVVASSDLKANVLAFHEKGESLWTSGALPHSDYLRLAGYPKTWGDRIWEMVDPPFQVPLRKTTCPVCHRPKWSNDQGELVDSLVVAFTDGGEVQASCRWEDCDALWAGEESLIALGKRLGLRIDGDTLRDMGLRVDATE